MFNLPSQQEPPTINN